jgi:hypothetical protein
MDAVGMVDKLGVDGPCASYSVMPGGQDTLALEDYTAMLEQAVIGFSGFSDGRFYCGLRSV